MMVKEELYDLKRTKQFRRMGKLFYTSQSTYLYDTGTGKVVKLDQNSKKLFEALFSEETNDAEFLSILNGIDTQKEVLAFIDKEHLLCNPPVIEFALVNSHYFEKDLECGQIIIELTGNCNLRCKYCIYNDFYEGNRSFNTSNIDFETARKAIDYAHAHRDPNHFAVTFYGGEPLLNFSVMRQCIDYCLNTFVGEEIYFSLTTNLTLMTEEVAEYLAQVPNMGILASIDGPEEVHDMARIKANGKGSFQEAYRGLKILSKAIDKYKKTRLSFNAVVMPPYTTERFNLINDFFESLTFLPESTEVRATYPTVGTISETYLNDLQIRGLAVTEEARLADWAREKGETDNFSGPKRNLYTKSLEDALVKIQNRPLYQKPMNHFHRNGCCIPGKRRLYVCTDGSYRVCERVGTAPVIGNVDIGIDVNAVISKYINEYDEQSLPDCSNCWAINLCDVCYALCYDEQGMNVNMKKAECIHLRERFVKWLQYYHELLEREPDKIEEISQIELS